MYLKRWQAVAASITVCMSLCSTVLSAQVRERDRPAEGGVPRDVAMAVASTWNTPSTRRTRGAFNLAASDTVHGDMAVVDGPATIAGVITGQLVAINADVSLESSAHVLGSITVVGGVVDGRNRGDVGGEIRSWHARLRYRFDNDTLVPEEERATDARWQRWRRGNPEQGAWSDLFVTTAHTYNRVEGLPIFIGPRFRTHHGDTRINVELFGVFRTGNRLDWEPLNLGHHVKAEVRQGNRSGFIVGGKLFDEVAPVERWTLSDNEVGLGAFVFSRDFRDYYQRHGGAGYVSLFAPSRASLTLSYGEERWNSRDARDPWSLFNNRDVWRVNPAADNGLLHLVTVNGHVDTRNDDKYPRSGWFADAEYERGTGTFNSVAPSTEGIRNTVPGPISYSRAMLDLRRYNRLAPNTQLNIRIVGGAALEGDPLPMQRRFSVSGADALPGYDFRSKIGVTDVGTCATGSDSTYARLGRPAQCDRMALVQVEWKSDFRFHLFGDDADDDRRWHASRFDADGTWVVFVNSGRGWLAGAKDGALHYPKDAFPSLGTWRTDVGGGFDFGGFGVYVAKAVSDSDQRANVFIRLGRRF